MSSLHGGEATDLTGAVTEPLITSRSNPLIKRVRSLSRDRRTRERERAFFCEGIQPVWRAMEAGKRIEVLVASPDLLADSPGERILFDAQQARVRVVRVSAEVFRHLSDREGPSGVAAVIRRDLTRLEDVPLSASALLVVLHETANPGNLGSIIRTADAAGADAVILLGNSADPFSPVAVKASMGSLFALPLVADASVDQFFAWATERAIGVMTTSARASTAYDEASYQPPLALMFGNEGTGLSPELVSRGDSQVRIPMFGTASSLNLSVATGILLFAARHHLGTSTPPR